MIEDEGEDVVMDLGMVFSLGKEALTNQKYIIETFKRQSGKNLFLCPLGRIEVISMKGGGNKRLATASI